MTFRNQPSFIYSGREVPGRLRCTGDCSAGGLRRQMMECVGDIHGTSGSNCVQYLGARTKHPSGRPPCVNQIYKINRNWTKRTERRRHVRRRSRLLDQSVGAIIRSDVLGSAKEQLCSGRGGGQLQEHRPRAPEAGGMGSVAAYPGEGVRGQWTASTSGCTGRSGTAVRWTSLSWAPLNIKDGLPWSASRPFQSVHSHVNRVPETKLL